MGRASALSPPQLLLGRGGGVLALEFEERLDERETVPSTRASALRPGWGALRPAPSALRLITAVALEVSGVWDDRRYLDMSLLSSPKTKAA